MKKMVLGLVMAIMIMGLVGCGGSESTNGDNNSEPKQESGFTPNQSTETTEQKNTETQQEETNASDMTVEEMQKYYDVEKYVGTPMIKNMLYLYNSSSDAYFFVEEEDFFSGNLYVENDERLVVGNTYKSIVCDNDTPDITRDDVVVYVFID